MRLARIISSKRILGKSGIMCVLLLPLIGLLLLPASCASSADRQTTKKFSRWGESMTVPYSDIVVSNGIVAWAKTLTNGYVLYDNPTARRIFTVFTNDRSTLFVLENRTNAIAAWGRSICLPPDKASYWATVIIRVRTAAVGNQVSVAIHGRHFARGLAFNIHTYEFDHEKDVDLSPCLEDERAILSELKSTMHQVGETNPPGVPPKAEFELRK